MFGLFGLGGGEKAEEPIPSKKPSKSPNHRSTRLTHVRGQVSARQTAHTPTGGSSLFDRYAGTSRSTLSARSNFETRTSRMRTTGVKLACYLNTECNHGRATIIHLPDECDTFGEVLPKIQARMQLDARMLFAAELFLPDGKKIKTYPELMRAAQIDTAIIVGCGEPFDHSTIPVDILEFHRHGGGRSAVRTVKKEQADKRRLDAHEKADSVRASGHGVYPNSVAVVTARSQTLETNRGHASQMRHEYMEQLMFRASQQKELFDRVQENNRNHKVEIRESRLRRMELEKERLESLAEERRQAQAHAKEKKEASMARMRAMHDKVRSDWKNSASLLRHKKLAAIANPGLGIEVTL